MRVAISGGTGFIGTALVTALAERGDEVIVLSRRPDPARAALPTAVSIIRWDGRSALPASALARTDAVVNLAGEPIVGRWTDAKKRRIRESRLQATNAIVGALAQLPADQRPRALVSGSAVGYYGDRGDEVLTETSPPGEGFLAGVCVEWELAAIDAEALDVRVVRMRTGLALGRGGVLKQLLPLFRAGLGGRIGSGRQWFPWVHLDDEVGIILRALDDRSLSGPINAVAPEEVRNAAFAQSLSAAVSRPCLTVAPALAVKLALGESSSLLLDSQRVAPARATALGYAFRYPTLSGALRAIVRSERDCYSASPGRTWSR